MPKEVDLRSGCKVSWYYYATKEEAEAAAKIARHNADIDESLGYDFGYCWPGTIYGPDEQKFKPGLWEVCVS